MINDKQFTSTLKIIKDGSDKLADSIHSAGVFAIAQANLHGNDGFAVRLVEAMGQKHDAKRVVIWLTKYGKLGVKHGAIASRKRKDITPENAQSFIDKAEETPYWILTPQAQLKMTIDYLALLQGLVKRHGTAEEKRKEGKEVTELHPEVLEQIKIMLKGWGSKGEMLAPTKAAVISL